MPKVLTQLTVSLDGFIAGANDRPDLPLGEGGELLFRWYSSGDHTFRWPSGTMTSQLSAASVGYFERLMPTVGVLVTGRRTFEIARGWGGQHPLNVPVIVLSHRPPPPWVQPDWPFTFMSGALPPIVAHARQVAGPKDVVIDAASPTQQCFRAGLLDEIRLDLVPVILGSGVRLFDHLGSLPVALDQTEVVIAPDVTHLVYRILHPEPSTPVPGSNTPEPADGV